MAAPLRLLERKTLTGPDGKPASISQIKLFDAAFPRNPDTRLQCVKGDIAEPDAIIAAMDADTSSVFHLAAVVSAGAEADFDLGYRVNLDGTRNLLEGCRKLKAPPRLVFASSLAVFGGKLPAVVDDSITTRTLEQSILGSAGYEVVTAVDGADGWKILSGHASSPPRSGR